MKRREAIKGILAGGCAAAFGGVSIIRAVKPHNNRQNVARGIGKRKVLILGMDGIDPQLLRRFIAAGKLPTFAQFISKNHFSELATTTPPHSPVAWASFITGTNPGGHGIFDFIHRDPATFTPYLSTSRSFDAAHSWKIGNYAFPLDSGRVELLRHGQAFWNILAAAHVDVSVFQIPANFPVLAEGDVREISGMGTPDLLGTYGTCTYITDAPFEAKKGLAGVRIQRVQLENHTVKTDLGGPVNSFRSDNKASELPVTLTRDPSNNTLFIEIGDQRLLLMQGEWSDWIPVRFPLLSSVRSISGMVRIFVKEVHPHLKVYLSPINIDPAEPSLPICNPESYSRELSQAVGRFYTQGFPADTKALSHGVLADEEYLHQAKIVIEENLRMLEHQLRNFNDGCFFFYFSSIDQNCHMLWRCMDPGHPLYNPKAPPEVKDGVLYFYERMDDALKMALGAADEHTTVLICSDHGFAPFTREFHLSTWLADEGYMAINDRVRLTEGDFFSQVDWSGTQAYPLGLNGLYLNLAGREKQGVVDPKQAASLKGEIAAKLRRVADPANGKPVVTSAYDSRTIYSGPHLELAPDLVLGYQRGYRISDEAILGGFGSEAVADRTDKWAADHCIDAGLVPGVLISNRECAGANPAIHDLAPSILALYGIEPPVEMTGKNILKT